MMDESKPTRRLVRPPNTNYSFTRKTSERPTRKLTRITVEVVGDELQVQVGDQLLQVSKTDGLRLLSMLVDKLG